MDQVSPEAGMVAALRGECSEDAPSTNGRNDFLGSTANRENLRHGEGARRSAKNLLGDDEARIRAAKEDFVADVVIGLRKMGYKVFRETRLGKRRRHNVGGTPMDTEQLVAFYKRVNR